MTTVTSSITTAPGILEQKDAGGRPPEKRRQIEEYILHRILRGRLKPGQRLPTQAALRDRFDATNQTVLGAVYRMSVSGFIRTDKRRGTFVCDHPPNLSRYALVFSVPPPAERAELTLWHAMVAEAQRINAENDPSRQLVPFFNINGHRDEPEYRRLVGEIEAHRLAGLVFASSPYLCLGDRRLSASRLPRSAFMSERDFADTPVVYNDIRDFGRRAAQFLLQRGRRKIAVIIPSAVIEQHQQDFNTLEFELTQSLRAHGVELPPWRITSLPHMAGRSVADVVRLMFHVERQQRPDALIIADDSHVRGTVEGLADWPERDRPLIVAHCNHPAPPTALPVTLLGYDIRFIMRALIEQVRAQVAGEEFENEVSCPARFSNEVEWDSKRRELDLQTAQA